MKTQLTTIQNKSRTCGIAEPVAGSKPVLALLMRLLWVAALALPVFGAQAAVVLTSLYSFTGSDGANPSAGLVQGSDGNFYGTTYGFDPTSRLVSASMAGLYGTVFRISTNGALTTVHSFTGNDGANPYAGLVQGTDAYFYGTTCYGGLNNSGTVFRISTNGALTNLYSFTGGNDGANPVAGLVQGSDGNFYGTTVQGGNTNLNNGYGNGTVFKISTNGALTTLYSCTDEEAAPNGLVQGSDGNFYGTTQYGGTNSGSGTVFRISTNGALTNLYSFTGGNDGANPVAGLVQGSDGNFYGTTRSGGTNQSGTVFQISTNGALTTLYAFGTVTDANGHPLDGAQPQAGLVRGSDGNFYGTTQSGGTNNVWNGGNGTVFRISSTGSLTTLYSFTGTNDGAAPEAGLVQGSDGSFYGTTVNGGQGGGGTVFRLTIVPEFQAMTLANSTLSLTWSTEAGGTYQLQWNADLSSSNWTNLRGPVTATGPALIATDSVTNAPRRFYRMVLSP